MKKLITISLIISGLFIIGCNKNPKNNTYGEPSDVGPLETLSETGEIENIKSSETGEIETLIDEYKLNNTGKSENLTPNDIELMEKVITTIEKQ